MVANFIEKIRKENMIVGLSRTKPSDYPKVIPMIRTCVVCGKKFWTNVKLNNTSIKANTTCSLRCRQKLTAKKYQGMLSNEDGKRIVERHSKDINCVVKGFVQILCPTYLDKDDMRQECYFELIKFYSLHKNELTEEKYPRAMFINMFKYVLKRAYHRFNHSFIQTEEDKFLDTGYGLENNDYPDYRDVEETIAYTQALESIVDIAKRSYVAKAALDKAWNIDAEQRLFKEAPRLFKKYNCKNSSEFYKLTKDGIECLYLSNMDKLKDLVNLSKMPESYSFQNLDVVQIFGKSAEEATQEETIDFFDEKKVVKCAWCGKEFVPTRYQKRYGKLFCSTLCQKRHKNREYLEKNREKIMARRRELAAQRKILKEMKDKEHVKTK